MSAAAARANMQVRDEARATRHYFDREFGSAAVKLLPGEYYVTGETLVLTTVLGSCVAACLRDTVLGVCGMNHFLLPQEHAGASADRAAAMRYGAYAMEVLINELLRAGARRERLQAKVFGGGAVLAQMRQMNVGDRNADFVLEYLQAERIPVVAQDLRGDLPRRVNFFAPSGRATVRRLRQSVEVQSVQREEQALAQALRAPAAPAPRAAADWML